jgi:hydrogenase nickel incorporation protein HypA/HybF
VHEVSLAEEILAIIERSQQEEPFTRVRTLRITIGDLCGVEQEALAFALTHMGPGTPIEDCELLFERVQGSGFCPACSKRVPLEFPQSPCIDCGHMPLEEILGTELRIRDLEVV